MANTDTRHIPYKGAAQGVTAVITGEVTFGFFNTPNVVGLVKEGRARGLAVTSLQRSPLLPVLPTMSESGLPGYETTVSFGLVVPANTPPQIVERIHDDLVKVLSDAALRDRLVTQGYDLIETGSPADYGRRIKADIEKWVPIVKASGASLD
jgi:tripartite-type tricarboxylate transporter receptor subunit TctC